jgi:MFS family permease
VPRTVLLLGVTSFFADVSSEMVYPFVPIFLTTVLGAPVGAVGFIEGLAEATASLLKIFSGWWSDRIRRRLPLVVAGYGLAAVAKLLLAVAAAWPMVLGARFVDRFGKGMRGSPRDALIADATTPEQRGQAFGVHRALDTAGAVTGPLLALALAAVLSNDLRWVFALAAIPGLLSVATLALVKERRPEARPATAQPPIFSWRALDGRLQMFFLASLVFAIGNSSDVFLILRAQNLGLSTVEVVLAYVGYNFVYMGASVPAGIVSDRLGRRNVFVLGLLIFALVYLGFAFTNESALIWVLFAVYGLYMALTDGVGKAIITDLALPASRATALGTWGTLTGVATLLASTLAGQLWDLGGPALPFLLGAAMALAGAAIAVAGLPKGRHVPAA